MLLIAGAKLSPNEALLQLQNGKVFKVGAQNVIYRTESFCRLGGQNLGMSTTFAILWHQSKNRRTIQPRYCTVQQRHRAVSRIVIGYGLSQHLVLPIQIIHLKKLIECKTNKLRLPGASQRP
jgi:hypothetical protein